MKSLWSESGERQAIAQWGEAHGEDFARRLYSARLIGRDPSLVLHGGGNVSLKSEVKNVLGETVATACVKVSGCDLATIKPNELPSLHLDRLRTLRVLSHLDDEAMVNECRCNLFDTKSATPSIETLLHAFLTHRYIDHSHADAVLTLTNQKDGEAAIRSALGDRMARVAIVPYIKPGFALAKAVAEAVDRTPDCEGVILLQHGLVTFGDDARTSYERHIDLVDACERFIDSRVDGRPLSISFESDVEPKTAASMIAPTLRGLLARDCERDGGRIGPILEWRGSRDVLAILNSTEAATFASAGAITGDHLIRTRIKPVLLTDPALGDNETLSQQLAKCVADYRASYESYLREFGCNADLADTSPRVVLIQGAGVFAWGNTKHDACVAADIAEHTLQVQSLAHRMGGYVPLSQKHLFDMEFRGLQTAKVASPDTRPLAGRVVAISGAAGAIGAGIAEACVDAGAHVALSDLDTDRLTPVVDRLNAKNTGRAFGLKMDVTDEASVVDGFDEIARTFGGVDVVVPNAGIAHVCSLEEMDVADFRRVIEINATGTMLFMREGIRLLKRQAIGGHLVVISSKNVAGPGKDFGAYSASKAAAHQLGRVAALELAGDGIRVNMVTPDAVFGDASTPSGLWETVGPQRAKSRGMKESDLADFYRERSLLKVPVLAKHVGNAVVFFASAATPTTGAVLPVDGGNAEAFPR